MSFAKFISSIGEWVCIVMQNCRQELCLEKVMKCLLLLVSFPYFQKNNAQVLDKLAVREIADNRFAMIDKEWKK